MLVVNIFGICAVAIFYFVLRFGKDGDDLRIPYFWLKMGAILVLFITIGAIGRGKTVLEVLTFQSGRYYPSLMVGFVYGCVVGELLRIGARKIYQGDKLK